MKECELCRRESARMYCESDQASLCWDCDAKVHAANFLVARHTRTLLCHHCQSLTPWSASGNNLGPTLSVCHSCLSARSSHQSAEGHEAARPDREDVDVDEEDDEIDDDDDDGDSEEEEEDEEECDNQVVPWSASPPPVASSSTSGDSFPRYSSSDTSNYNVQSPSKRMREGDEDDVAWQNEVESSRSLQTGRTLAGDVEAAASVISHRLKRSLLCHGPSASMAVQAQTLQNQGRNRRGNGRDPLL